MLSVEQVTRGARGTIAKTIKSTKQATTKFTPPTHPAIIVTSAFTSPHISKLKSALEENFIAYGMQTSKKKVNRPPGFPTDKNFIIVDDSLGPSILEGEFLGLKMCRVDYPRTNNLKDVIKKFDKYIGLGKETVQQNERLEEIVEPGWQQNQTNLKMLQAGNTQGKNQLQQFNGGFGNKIQLEDLQKVLEVKEKAQNFKDVFKRSKKNQSPPSSSNDSKDNNKKNKKSKKQITEKIQKLLASKERQNSNIKLMSVNKMDEGGPNKYLQKRSLFMLLTNKQSGNYEKEIQKLSSGQNKRMIAIKQVSEYYKLCYQKGQGENCLLLSPNVAFKELHKFRNLKDVYIFGDDPEFCSQLIKGNIKKAALDPESLQKILNSEGFNKDQPKQYVQPKRWVGSSNQKPANEQDSKNKKQNQDKPSLFSRFVNFVKGKDKQKKRNESVNSENSLQRKKRKTQKKNKSSQKSISSLSSLSSSSKKSSSLKSKKIQKAKPKVFKQQKQKPNNEIQQSNTQKFDPVSLGRLVNDNDNKKAEYSQMESVKSIIKKDPSRRVIKLKSTLNGKQMIKQNVQPEKLNQEDEVFNLKLNSKVPSAQMENEQLNNQNAFEKSNAKPNQIVFLGRGGKKQGSILVNPPKMSSEKQRRKSSLTKRLKFEPEKIILQKNKKSSSSSLSEDNDIINSRKKPSSQSNKQKQKQKQNQHQVISFQKSKVANQKFNQDYYDYKKNTNVAKQQKIYRKLHDTQPVFHFQKPSDDQNQSKLIYSQVINKKKPLLVNKMMNGPVNQTIDEIEYQIPKVEIKDIPVVASNLIRTSEIPLNVQANLKNPLQNKFMRSLSGTPGNVHLPFDETKYDKIIQNGIIVYRPKGFSLYNNVPISPKPFHKTPTLYFNPNIPPNIINRSNPNPFFLSGIPLKQTTSTQGSQSNNIHIPQPQMVKRPQFSTYQYFKKNNFLPQEIKKGRQSDIESQVTCHKCKTPKVSKQKQRDIKRKRDKENQNPFQNQYCTRPSNKLTKTRQLYESLDSDESSSKYKKKASSLDKYMKNRDPLSSILDQTSHQGIINHEKNYSVLYVVHSMFPPQLIKQLFQISDSSDTIQTFSKPEKMAQIIEKGKNVFDFILVFNSNFEQQTHGETKGLFRVSYNNNGIKTFIEKDTIRINRTKDLKDILKRIFENKPIKKNKSEETNKIGCVYFKDFNRAIRDLAKIVKRQYPEAQTRKYFSVMDLPTKLPSVKNQLTLILIDQISFNQITKYCQQQQLHNRNLIKICIPKSSQAMKLCKNQAGIQRMIWLTERQLQDPDFIMRRLIKRNK